MAPPTVSIEAAADNLAGWHDTSALALGWPTRRTPSWWTCRVPGPSIYFSAVSLRPALRGRADGRVRALATAFEHPAATQRVVCDSWDDLDLTALGLRRRARPPWMHRPVAPLPDAVGRAGPADLVIRPVTDPAGLRTFEHTAAVGFGTTLLVAPFDIHAPGILDDPRMHALIGWSDGRPVGVSMAFVTAGCVGVYGVACVPGQRRRGVGRAMTLGALATAPDRAAVLQPSEEAATLYAALGFSPLGPFSVWD